MTLYGAMYITATEPEMFPGVMSNFQLHRQHYVTIRDMLHSFKPFSIFITDRMMLHKASGSWEPARSLPAEDVEFFELRICPLP